MISDYHSDYSCRKLSTFYDYDSDYHPGDYSDYGPGSPCVGRGFLLPWSRLPRIGSRLPRTGSRLPAVWRVADPAGLAGVAAVASVGLCGPLCVVLGLA